MAQVCGAVRGKELDVSCCEALQGSTVEFLTSFTICCDGACLGHSEESRTGSTRYMLTKGLIGSYGTSECTEANIYIIICSREI